MAHRRERLHGIFTMYTAALEGTQWRTCLIGAANREGRHLEVNYEFAARSRHSQQSLTF
jgi:hypothetical protein